VNHELYETLMHGMPQEDTAMPFLIKTLQEM